MMTDKNIARIAGLCYLIVIATGLFSEVFVRQALRVPNDALATAYNTQTNEMLFRLKISLQRTLIYLRYVILDWQAGCN